MHFVKRFSKRVGPGKYLHLVKLECLCGKSVDISLSKYRQNNKIICDCEILKKKYPREYRIWSGMKRRCKDIKNKRYGGRGISHCKRWESFELFIKDMGPSKGLTIDRIDNNGNYEPDNCRWSTVKEQANNKEVVKIARKRNDKRGRAMSWYKHKKYINKLIKRAIQKGEIYEVLLYKSKNGTRSCS